MRYDPTSHRDYSVCNRLPGRGAGLRPDDKQLPAPLGTGCQCVPRLGNAFMTYAMPFIAVLSSRKDLLYWAVVLCVSTYIQDE